MRASVERRGRFEPCNEVAHVVMNDFPVISDHVALHQGRDKSKIYPAGFSTNSRPIQGGDIRNSTTGYNDSRSCGKSNVHPQTLKNDITVPMSAEAKLFSADEYIGVSNVSDICSSKGNTMRTQDEHKNKGKDLFYCDWPDLDSFVDFEAGLRDFASTFEIGSNYFEDPMWSSICSPDVQLVPSSHSDNTNLSTVANERATNPILKSTVSVPDTTSTEPVVLHQIKMANPFEMHQPSSNEGRETPFEEIEHFSRHSDADLFCPFGDMLVPTASSIMLCNEETLSSSTCSGPDLVVAYASHSTKKSHDPSHATPDMILDGMSENPLEMYFPPLTTYEQPEVLVTNDSSAQMHQFPPAAFAGDGVLNNAGLQFCSKGRTCAELCQNPRSPLILESVPVKHLGFQKLQEGMNQLDVGTKTCIRDALYRLANSVEQKHCVANQLAGGVVGSSAGANRLKSSTWTETQASPMDRSVAQLLLQKPLYRETGLRNPPRQANHIT